MKDGIYFVVFKSGQNEVGNGTVVVKNDAVNGGDFGFTYRGKIDNGRLNLHVAQHDPRAQNVIPGLNEYTMNLDVRETAAGYSLQGNIEGVPQASLAVQAKFIGDLI